MMLGAAGYFVPENTSALAQSFSCAKAKLPDEIVICRNAELSDLDSRATAGFQEAAKAKGMDVVQPLGRQFLHERHQCKRDKNCIRKNLTQAIAAYQSMIGSSNVDALIRSLGSGTAEPAIAAKASPQQDQENSRSQAETRSIVVTEALAKEFAAILSVAILRPSFQDINADEARSYNEGVLTAAAKAILASSVRKEFTKAGVRYDLLYNWMADIFILISYDGNDLTSIGVIPGATVAQTIYRRPPDTNVFDVTLKERPATFKFFAEDIERSEKNPDRIFNQFVYKEGIGALLRENIVGALQLLAQGSNDPCRTYAKSYVSNAALTFGGRKAAPSERFYTGYGFRTPEGRVLAFADEQTNRHMGFILFDAGDVTTCKPNRVITSTYDR